MVLGKPLPLRAPPTSCFAGTSAREAGSHPSTDVGRGCAHTYTWSRHPLQRPRVAYLTHDPADFLPHVTSPEALEWNQQQQELSPLRQWALERHCCLFLEQYFKARALDQ